MIKISRKTRYALRALIEMACGKKKQLFYLKDLAKHQNISRKYLEIIFSILRKHGIVNSRVGKKGGFYINPDLKNISALRILECLEGKIEIVECKHKGRACDRVIFCPTRAIWKDLNRTIRDYLSAINLKELSSKKDIQKNVPFLPLQLKNIKSK